jgi:hypothetical protein
MKVKKEKCDDGEKSKGFGQIWKQPARKEGMAVVEKLIEECSHKAPFRSARPKMKERCGQMPIDERMKSCTAASFLPKRNVDLSFTFYCATSCSKW